MSQLSQSLEGRDSTKTRLMQKVGLQDSIQAVPGCLPGWAAFRTRNYPTRSRQLELRGTRSHYWEPFPAEPPERLAARAHRRYVSKTSVVQGSKLPCMLWFL